MPHLARQPDAKLRIGNVSREKQVERRLEEVCIFQEKWTLLRKVDGETLVDGHLGLVGFHLAEIGIHGCVQHQAVFQDGLAVKAHLRVELPRNKLGIRGVTRVQRPIGTFIGIRN